MQISLKVRLDEKEDRFVAELETGATVTRSLPIGPPMADGGKRVSLGLDDNGYIVAVIVPGAAEILKEIAGDDEPKPKKK